MFVRNGETVLPYRTSAAVAVSRTRSLYRDNMYDKWETSKDYRHEVRSTFAVKRFDGVFLKFIIYISQRF